MALPEGEQRRLVVCLHENGPAVSKFVNALNGSLHGVGHVGADAFDRHDPDTDRP